MKTCPSLLPSSFSSVLGCWSFTPVALMPVASSFIEDAFSYMFGFVVLIFGIPILFLVGWLVVSHYKEQERKHERMEQRASFMPQSKKKSSPSVPPAPSTPAPATPPYAPYNQDVLRIITSFYQRNKQLEDKVEFGMRINLLHKQNSAIVKQENNLLKNEIAFLKGELATFQLLYSQAYSGNNFMQQNAEPYSASDDTSSPTIDLWVNVENAYQA